MPAINLDLLRRKPTNLPAFCELLSLLIEGWGQFVLHGCPLGWDHEELLYNSVRMVPFHGTMLGLSGMTMHYPTQALRECDPSNYDTCFARVQGLTPNCNRIVKYLQHCLELCKKAIGASVEETSNATTDGQRTQPVLSAGIFSDELIASLPSKQRALINALHGKGRVKIDNVSHAVYRRQGARSVDTLLKLKDRTNARLAKEGLCCEIKKEGDTLLMSAIM